MNKPREDKDIISDIVTLTRDEFGKSINKLFNTYRTGIKAIQNTEKEIQHPFQVIERITKDLEEQINNTLDHYSDTLGCALANTIGKLNRDLAKTLGKTKGIENE